MRLEAEEAVDLLPDKDREADARADHRRHGQPEAEGRQLPLVRPLFAVPALQTLSTVLPLNCGRVEKLLRVLGLLPFRQSHPRECKGQYLRQGQTW